MAPTDPRRIRLLIVDDHEVVRIGLRTLFGRFPNIEVVGEAGCVQAALTETERLAPDVVLMDIRLPDGSGFDACRTIQKLNLNTRVLVLTSFADDNVVFKDTAETNNVSRDLDLNGLWFKGLKIAASGVGSGQILIYMR